jgi:phosphate transport system substrate-binding protein
VKRSTLTATTLAAAAALSLVLSACGGGNEAGADGGSASGSAVSGEVLADGSSTVQPLTAAAGELFKEVQPGVNVSVGTSGTGGGFKKFCQGQTDISDASRPIKDAEKTLCQEGGVTYTELHVATDALTVVVSKSNEFVTCLTTAQLKKLWEPTAEGKVTTWNQVDAKFPNTKIDLYGPGTDSGTFDYFTAEINGEEGKSRTDYNASEDDNVIVQGVSGSKGAIGYFGFSYYEANADKLKAVKIDSGSGCVAPSMETAQNGTYAPLSRPLFIYVSTKAYTSKPQVKAFVDWYASNDEAATKAAEFIPLNAEQRAELKKAAAGIAG